MKKFLTILCCSLLLGASFISCNHFEAPQSNAKYVFYFIGDGMGLAQVSLAEAWQGYKSNDGICHKPVCFSQFPSFGLATTYSASNWITCSSAAGTALATGSKTNNGMLGMTPDSTKLTSIAYTIKNAGYAVGITSTVTMDHATPASFYASAPSRSNYYDIANQLPTTNFDFFGGGGFIQPTGKKKDKPSVYDAIEKAGYVVAYGVEDFESKMSASNKMLLLQEENPDKDLPYAIDRKGGELTQAQVVEAAVRFLEKAGGNGFFLMSEGGKIDWACHSNDAMGTIMEVIDFSQAIDVALQFAAKHPNETLIVVTADHETGGLALAYESGYQLYFDKLATHTNSKEYYTTNSIEAPDFENDYNEAHIHWATGSHSGIPVPVYAYGAGSDLFAGRMDNTDIPRKICNAMGIEF